MRVCELIDAHQDEILREWADEARRRHGSARALTTPALFDDIPSLLRRLAAWLRHPDGDEAADFDACADEHAFERLAQEIDLRQVVDEYRILRSVVQRRALTAALDDVRELIRFNEAIDAAIAASVYSYSERRERLARQELEAFADIGAALGEKRSFSDFLEDLLDVFMQSSPDVDTATILLCKEGEEGQKELRVRSSFGLGELARGQYAIPYGKGFAGTIAATRRPLLLTDASRSDLILNDAIRERGLRALYGVPLLCDGELLGVAHVGSRTVSEFSGEALRLFGAVAERASNAIAQASLREQLARRNAQLEAIMAALPDASFVSDRERFTLVNPATEAMLGLPPEEIVSKGIAEVARRIDIRTPRTGEALAVEDLPILRALGGEHVVVNVVATNVKTGRACHARVAAAPIVVDGSIVGAVAVWTDTTEIMALEQQRETFTHAIVHDLRNPLNSIVTTAQVVSHKIAKRYGDSWAVDRLQRLTTNALRLDRLLRDLLDIALAKSGRIQITPTRFDVGELLDEQLAIWSASSPKHSLRVHGSDVEVLADRERISQVLDNLIGNAIKYSPHGGRVDISCAADAGEVVVTVRDEGIGLTPEEQRMIFNPYTRAGRHAWASGHGLGLYISSEIVRQHGGRMGVRSEPGTGSEFWFTLPLAPPLTPPPPMAA